MDYLSVWRDGYLMVWRDFGVLAGFGEVYGRELEGLEGRVWSPCSLAERVTRGTEIGRDEKIRN